MKKQFVMISLLSLVIFNSAYAEDFKLKCSLENDHTKEVLAVEEVNLKLPTEEGTEESQEIILKANLGKFGEAKVEGDGSIFKMNGRFVITVFATLNVPKMELLISNHGDTTLDHHYGGIAHSGALVVLQKEIYRFGCVINRGKP